ncbi:unnamed protein product [Amoebophrya sp. A25]|nr:unnamed protein product [Amoebophrya sp. A25]|eukprot:GSA25T00008713001.1
MSAPDVSILYEASPPSATSWLIPDSTARLLSYIFTALLVLIVILRRYAQIKVTEGIEIPEVSPERVEAIVRDLESWKKWAPWLKIDPNAKVEIVKERTVGGGGAAGRGLFDFPFLGGTSSTKDAVSTEDIIELRWNCPQVDVSGRGGGQEPQPHSLARYRSGAGTVRETIAVCKDGEPRSVEFAVQILAPMRVQWTYRFAFIPKASDDDTITTRVLWEVSGSLPFYLGFLCAVFSSVLKMDLGRGLKMLKDLAQTGEIPSKILDPPVYGPYNNGTSRLLVGLLVDCTMEQVGKAISDSLLFVEQGIVDEIAGVLRMEDIGAAEEDYYICPAEEDEQAAVDSSREGTWYRPGGMQNKRMTKYRRDAEKIFREIAAFEEDIKGEQASSSPFSSKKSKYVSIYEKHELVSGRLRIYVGIVVGELRQDYEDCSGAGGLRVLDGNQIADGIDQSKTRHAQLVQKVVRRISEKIKLQSRSSPSSTVVSKKTDSPKKVPDQLALRHIPAHPHCMHLTHLGPYRHLGNAWSQGHAMARNAEIAVHRKHPCFEEYHTDPRDNPKEEDVKTVLYFPLMKSPRGSRARPTS